MASISLSVGYKEYPMEAHEVHTKDGYILTLVRIIGANKSSKSVDESLTILNSTTSKDEKRKPPVLFVHGFICSAEHWLVNDGNEPGLALPYRMTDDGYDCWLANLRGTPLSRGHTDIPIESQQYWDFSFHEIGQFDIPAMIDYILKTTGNQQLTYIGHSMGCGVLLLGAAINAVINSKIKLMIALAPGVYGGHITNMYFRPLIPLGNFISKFKYIRTREVFGTTFTEYGKRLCFRTNSSKVKAEKLGARICYNFGARFGFASRPSQLKEYQQSNIANVFPRPTSLKLFCHGMQNWYSGNLHHFNYGRAENFKRYGTPMPPEYLVENVKIPVAIFYSNGDELCTPKDIATLAKVLGTNLVEYRAVDCQNFSHLDFLISKNANKLVYDEVYKVLNRFDEIPVSPTKL